MANKKAFVRYADNKLVPGSTIIAPKPPKVGIWKEIPYDLCCLTTTTTSSTSSTTSTTTTACPDCPTFCTENWMFENFDGTTFRNGDPIPEVTDVNAWGSLTTPAWCYYNNDIANGRIYGKLYNWYAVNDPRGLAPVGWRIPTNEDWTALITCLGGSDVAGGKMKTTGIFEQGTGLWATPNNGATNSSGWSGFPGGSRGNTGNFLSNLGFFGYWWSATEFNFNNAWYYTLSAIIEGDKIKTFPNFKRSGFSVRLIKDI